MRAVGRRTSLLAARSKHQNRELSPRRTFGFTGCQTCMPFGMSTRLFRPWTTVPDSQKLEVERSSGGRVGAAGNSVFPEVLLAISSQLLLLIARRHLTQLHLVRTSQECLHSACNPKVQQAQQAHSTATRTGLRMLFAAKCGNTAAAFEDVAG